MDTREFRILSAMSLSLHQRNKLILSQGTANFKPAGFPNQKTFIAPQQVLGESESYRYFRKGVLACLEEFLQWKQKHSDIPTHPHPHTNGF